jgi:RNA polymerase sigma-32 factor
VSAAAATARSGEEGAGRPASEEDETLREPEVLDPEPETPADDELLAGDPESAGELVPVRPTEVVPSDPLTRYLQEVHRYPRLEREEEEVLARRYLRGDRRAAFRLVTSNLQLVVKIALMFRRAIRNMLDLIQEGNVGLLEALRRFDPDQKVRFSTYAAWWIKAYILKFLLDNHRLVRVGTTNARRKLLYNLRQQQRQLEAQGIRPTPRLLAEHFGVSQDDVKDVQQALDGADLPLDAPVGDEGRATYADLMPASTDVEAEVVDQDMREKLQEHLASFRRSLAARDQAILDRRLLAEEPATLQDLGDEFGVTREAIRQSEARLTERLRTFLDAEMGEDAILHFTRGRRR